MNESSHRKLRYIQDYQGKVIGALGPVEVETVNDGKQLIMTVKIPVYKVNELGQLVRVTN